MGNFQSQCALNLGLKIKDFFSLFPLFYISDKNLPDYCENVRNTNTIIRCNKLSLKCFINFLLHLINHNHIFFNLIPINITRCQIGTFYTLISNLYHF